MQRFKQLNFTVIAGGDSYNDTAMLAEADFGILFRPSPNPSGECPKDTFSGGRGVRGRHRRCQDRLPAFASGLRDLRRPGPAGLAKALDFDLLWTVNDGPVDWGKQGRVTDMGHAADAARFADVLRRFGKTHCIVGSKVDCRTMAFNSWAEVKREMDETLALAKQCPGFMWAVGNHIPANVSDETCIRYMDYLRAHWARE